MSNEVAAFIVGIAVGGSIGTLLAWMYMALVIRKLMLGLRGRGRGGWPETRSAGISRRNGGLVLAGPGSELLRDS